MTTQAANAEKPRSKTGWSADLVQDGSPLWYYDVYVLQKRLRTVAMCIVCESCCAASAQGLLCKFATGLLVVVSCSSQDLVCNSASAVLSISSDCQNDE